MSPLTPRVLVLLLVVASPLSAAVLRVPLEHPTIQDAISVADPGDVIRGRHLLRGGLSHDRA